MKRFYRSSFSAIALSAMLIGGAVTTVSFIPSPALAKSDNANSNSNGNSSSNNRNENNNRGGNGNGNGRNNNNGRGAVASSLGALNAAHANANALANAASNSRVGMIAIYKLAVVATAEAGVAFDVIETTRSTFVVQCGPVETDLSLDAEECQTILDTATEEAQLAAAEGVIVEPFTVETYVASLDLAVEEAGSAEADAKLLEDSALEAAANKVTNEEVIAALWELLDI